MSEQTNMTNSTVELVALILNKGIFSSENFRGLLLIGLAIYCVYKGYTPQQISNAGSAIMAKMQQYQDTVVSVVTVVAALVDNIHYTKRRTELKKNG